MEKVHQDAKEPSLQGTDTVAMDSLSLEDEKKLVRKIDLRYVFRRVKMFNAYKDSLMPLLIISYGLQYLDSKFATHWYKHL